MLRAGEDLFVQYGPKRATITDVTDAVGVSKPIFYRFFDSKAEFYVAILRRRNEAFARETRSELEDVATPYEGLKRLLYRYKSHLEENPLVRRSLTREHYRDVFRNVPPELLRELQEESVPDVLPLVRSLQERSDGRFAEYDPATVLGVLETVGLQVAQRAGDDDGAADYDQVMSLLISSLARGLTADTYQAPG
nr:TetR/AcrR family transcriptional regulator [Halomarina salina]